MVESRGRKAAFLREAARTVGLPATVEGARFETLVERKDYAGSMDVVSIRAVRMDEPTLRVAERFAKPGGIIALFTSEAHDVGDISPLIGRAKLIRLSVPRGTDA